jgi:integrase
MSHNAVTQRLEKPMSYMLKRNGRYYLNLRVPTELRQFYKTVVIRESLHTSDYRKAAEEVRFEVARYTAEFQTKREQIRASRATEPRVTFREMSDQEAHRLVLRWFIGMEKKSAEWWEKDGRQMSAEQLKECRENFGIDATVFDGGTAQYEGYDGTSYLDGFLSDEGLDVPKGTVAYEKLRRLFRLALVENAQRKLDLVTHRSAKAHEPIFRDVFAHTPVPEVSKLVTLGEMLTRFSKWLSDAERSAGTQRTYKIPARILREVIGEHTAVNSITKDSVERLFDLLRRAPANATQRYRGLTLTQAIERADKAKDPHRLGGKTLANYFNNIVAIFNFAVEKGLMGANPAKDKYLRATFERDDDDKEKAHFQPDELNLLFRAPLYTGCKNDGNGYATPGEWNTRRGRFWLPLIALFHGFRCNEVAQLYTEDVSEEEGIPFFEIREERADGTKCDKRLKTKQSKRRVPIHSEILRIGFLDFVEERRRDDSHPRLFPDLPCGATGYFSNPFSKWFARFVTTTLGEKCEATFHSFRHQFRDALEEGGVPIPDVERLGGWELMQRSAESHYGKGPSLRRLREHIEKVNYPGLELLHLHPRAK